MDVLNKLDWMIMAGLLGFFWWWLKNISLNMKALSESINELKLQLANGYVPKDEFERMVEKCSREHGEFYKRIGRAEKHIAIIQTAHKGQHGQDLGGN